MPRRPTAARLALLLAALGALGCRARSAPRFVPHAAWEAHPPLGHPADATRRNVRAPGALAFRGLTITVLAAAVDSAAVDSGATPVEVARLRLAAGDHGMVRTTNEEDASHIEGDGV